MSDLEKFGKEVERWGAQLVKHRSLVEKHDQCT